MVFTEVPQALLFRIELNTNYVCAFIALNTTIPIGKYDLQRLTEELEDRCNLVDLMKTPAINVAQLLKDILHEKEHSNGD